MASSRSAWLQCRSFVGSAGFGDWSLGNRTGLASVDLLKLVDYGG